MALIPVRKQLFSPNGDCFQLFLFFWLLNFELFPSLFVTICGKERNLLNEKYRLLFFFSFQCEAKACWAGLWKALIRVKCGDSWWTVSERGQLTFQILSVFGESELSSRMESSLERQEKWGSCRYISGGNCKLRASAWAWDSEVSAETLPKVWCL